MYIIPLYLMGAGSDTEAMDELRKRGISPVAVPDNDPDHQATVYENGNAE